MLNVNPESVPEKCFFKIDGSGACAAPCHVRVKDRRYVPRETAKKVPQYYRNPICLAKEYKRMIDSGEVKNQSDLARKLSVSRTCVWQALSLHKFDSELFKAIEKLGAPILQRIATERMLREYLKHPESHHEYI